ncbi:MAG: S9 family peptidase [Nocardioidaceae bacterium]|nr:S9 family peptidase [Nocardioidaceae bacterium]NUS51250.1 S9 family peptidase [Nocardioidaceae bacterium]
MTTPPRAPQQAYEHVEHGVRRPDPYHWMRATDSPAFLSHLEAERTWYESATGHLRSLVDALRAEMTGRVPATDRSVSWRRQGFSYYTVVPAGREYAQMLREFNTSSAVAQRDPQEEAAETDANDTNRASRRRWAGPDPQLLLDANLLADDSGYLELGLTLVSPDDRLLAYSVDRTGDEVYELRFRDLETGEDLADIVPRSYYGGAWSAGSDQFFYTVHDDAYRPHQVWRHRLGTPVEQDVLVLDEPDERFELELRSTRSGGLVVVWSASRDTTEVWVVDARTPDAPARSVGGRRAGIEYHAEHLVLPDGTDTLLLVTNDGATEYRLASAPVPRDADQTPAAWTPVRPEAGGERLERADAFAGHVVLGFRSGGRHRLRLLPLDDLGGPGVVVDPTYDGGQVELAYNCDFAASAVTVCDQSWVQPPVWSDADLDTGARTERHHKEAPGHDPAAYLTTSATFPAPDGTPVPATVVRHRDTPLDGTAPALLYGYGAYEYSWPPEWDAALPSLLDRGVVFVHTHVRGGGENGRHWWLGGRLASKPHTFTDHVAVADGLAADRLVDGDRIATRGLSAGGLLQGAVLSLRPDRWRAVVAEVPFVDVVSTMLDPSIPLTVTEWDEWGDPRDPEQFRWLLGYSPYDNLPAAGSRPDLLVTGALHDPRVMVFEPAKWVAALRESDPDWAPRCLFRAETGAGAHIGPSGRFAHLAYEAEVYAWLLDRLDATDA